MASGVTVKDDSTKLAKMLARLLNKGALSVGILASGGTYPDEGGGPAGQVHEAKTASGRIKDVFAGFDAQGFKKKGKREKTGAPITIGEIAAIHEFGLGSCPQRSFLQGWADENKDKIKEVVIKGAQALASGKLETPLQFLNQVGSWSVGQVQMRMAQNIPPPLAPETIRRKGSSVALIDTGQLRSSITYRVDAVETAKGVRVSK